MANKVSFIIGRNGSGKSEYIRHLITKDVANGQGVALIVPEQFTFETERELSAVLGAGLLNVYVLSFTSLARKVLSQARVNAVFLSRQGRRMVIRKAILECTDSLRAFKRIAHKSGFVKECDQLFMKFKRAGITPDALKTSAQNLDDKLLLKDKLTDFAIIYERVEAYLSTRFMDGENAFNELASRISDSLYAGLSVYIDGFDMISKELYNALRALINVSVSVNITVSADPDAACRDKSVFVSERRVMNRLCAMFDRNGIAYDFFCPPKEFSITGERTAALAHLEHEAFARPFMVYDESADGIRVFAATKRNAEAGAVADEILRLVKGGLRFNDIAVISTDMESYLNTVAREFRARNIAYFTDIKRPFLDFSLPRLVLSALSSAVRAFPPADITDTLKTGLTGVSDEDADALENYIIRYGITSLMFTRPFTRGDVPEAAERARLILFPPLMELRASLAKANTVAQKTEALYAYLLALNIQDKLNTQATELKEENNFSLMEETEQVYNTLIEVLSQLHAVMGDAKISSREYLEIIEEGFSSYEIGVIPTTADQVLFGSIGRTRAKNVRVLFVMGASEGSFPKYVADEALIDDRELSALEDMGFNVWDSSKDQYASYIYDVYGAVAKPKDELFLSYVMDDSEGSATECSLITRMREIFPKLAAESDLNSFSAASRESGFNELPSRLRSVIETGDTSDRDLFALYAYFISDEQSTHRLSLLEEGLFYKSIPSPLDIKLARSLYSSSSNNVIRGSVSQLETYNICPFRHFAQYGLRVSTRREYREKSADIGTFCHNALSLFTDALLKQTKPLVSISFDDVLAILDSIMPELIATHNSGVLMETARNRALLKRLVARIKATAWAITRQLALGGFKVSGTEVVFGDNAPLPAIILDLNDGIKYALSGKIDRLDSFSPDDNAHYIRIIDYKTGSADFSFTDAANGLKMQLPLYISAALAADKAAKAAGMYYQKITDPVVKNDGSINEDILRKKLFEVFTLSGISLNDDAVLDALKGSDPDAPIIKSRSQCITTASNIDLIISGTHEKAKETAQSILRGDITPSPYMLDQKNACTYCDYGDACLFDPLLEGCKYRNIEKKSSKDFFNSEDNK